MTKAAQASLLALTLLLPGAKAAGDDVASLPTAAAGVLDLSRWRFVQDGPIQLTGDWSFCFGVLLEPGEEAPSTGSCGSLRVPGLWAEDGTAPGRGVGSYRLRILLPEDPPPLSLHVGAPMTAHRLFIDGRPYPGTGRVARTPESHRSQLQNRLHVLPESGEELELLVHVANFDFRSGGLRRRWILGSQEDVRNWATAVTLRDTTLATIYLLVGLFFLGFFVNRPQERTRLYFGLAGVALGLRAVPGNYSDLSQLLAPALMFPTTLRLEYFANNFVVFAGAGYFAHKVPLDMPRTLVRMIQLGALAGMAAAVFLPLSQAQIPMRAAYGLGAALLVISIAALTRAARRGDPNVRITLAAVPLCLAVVLFDSIRAEGVVGGAMGIPSKNMLLMVFTESSALSPTTMLALVLTEAVVLMRSFSLSFRTIEKLSTDLAASNEDLRETNCAAVRFVPFDFLRLLEKGSIREVERGDSMEADMAIMFCDIRAFTSIAEAMTPDQAFGFVNTFTEAMEAPIHEQDGFINEYLGDCILALFPSGSDAAVRAGIGMVAALEAFNRREFARETGVPPIRIGIGVNTGSLMLGTIGGSERLAHTVIGDSVNVASRVEALTRTYGTTFLISGSARDDLSDPESFPLRLLDRVVLKGRSDPIPIWEVLDALDSEVRERTAAILGVFEEARRHYEQRAFPQAEALFQECLTVAPGDVAAKRYIERCRRFEAEGVSADWRGESASTEE